MKKNNIIAHRGVFNNIDIPENSLKSFKKALDKGYGIEYDIQRTKDNILIVFHDPNLKRMTGIDKKIKDITYDELKQYNLLQTNEKIPTFKETLELINDKVLMDIEIKSLDNRKEACNQIIEELKPYNNFMLKSFDPRIVRYLKKNYPEKTVGYLINWKKYPKFLDIILSKNFMIKYTKADFLAIHKHLLNNKRFKKLNNKYPFYIWTIKDKKEITSDDYTYICNNL